MLTKYIHHSNAQVGQTNLEYTVPLLLLFVLKEKVWDNWHRFLQAGYPSRRLDGRLSSPFSTKI